MDGIKEQVQALINKFDGMYKEALVKSKSLVNSRDWVNAEKQEMKAKVIQSMIEDLQKVKSPIDKSSMVLEQFEYQVLRKAFEKWGKDTQINKLQEEALELALVLNQINCPTKEVPLMQEKIYDELADVSIMMMQCHLFLFDSDRIKERIKFKLQKLNDKYFSNGS